MAQMERNVNLEEIDADALFGIDALKGQSILQKLIFFCCLLAGIVANVCMPMFLHNERAKMPVSEEKVLSLHRPAAMIVILLFPS